MSRPSRTIRTFTAIGFAALVGATQLVTAPASAAPDPKARYGDTMVIGITGDPGTLNGTTSSNFVEKIIASNVFSMLIRLDTNFKPVPDVSRLYVSTNIRPVSFTNGAGYRNPKVDELFMKGQIAIKPEDRAKAYREVQKVLTDEVPAIWPVEYGIVGVWSKKLHGLHTWSAYSYYQFRGTWSDGGKGQ